MTGVISPEKALNKLLASLFTSDELRQHLILESQGDQMRLSLPEGGVSLAELVFKAVAALERHGLIDRHFFDKLEAARPKRSSEIREVRHQWLHNPKLDRGELWADGRYELKCECGKGGFGLVWQAIDTQTGAFVALKILLEQHSNDRRIRQRFYRGAAALARISHPAIVHVRSEVVQEGLRFFYVMDFIEGTSLDKLVGERPRPDLLENILQIGEALNHLHTTHDLLHRDIKPSNILITSKRQAKLIDFDLVTGDAFAPMTTTALGTWRYTPPEAFINGKASPAYDVFSLARTVEFVLRGREPTTKELETDSVASLDTSEAVKATLQAALIDNPHVRTQSMKRFCGDLRAALEAPTEGHSATATGASQITLSTHVETAPSTVTEHLQLSSLRAVTTTLISRGPSPATSQPSIVDAPYKRSPDPRPKIAQGIEFTRPPLISPIPDVVTLSPQRLPQQQLNQRQLKQRDILARLNNEAALSELPLSQEAQHVLKHAGLVRAAELLDLSSPQLLRTKSKTLHEITELRILWSHLRDTPNLIQSTSGRKIPPTRPGTSERSLTHPLIRQLATAPVFLARVPASRRAQVLLAVNCLAHHKEHMPAIAFAAIMQVAAHKVSGLVSHIAEDLNTDGDAAIYFDPVGRQVVLNTQNILHGFNLQGSAL